MVTTRRVLCSLAWLSVIVSLSSAHAEDYGRHLLQKSKKQLADESREEDALEAFFLQQSQLNKEQEAQIRFGTEEAISIVRKIEKASRKKQVSVIADLWANAKGVSIVKTLAILIDFSPKRAPYYYAVNSDAMELAEGNGYTFKVSEALYNALAVTDDSNDHHYLLNGLLHRMKVKNKESKGSGCQYIEFLFTDAEAWAIDDGRTQQFFRGFDNDDYLPISECFLPVCKGTAAKCCAQPKAVSSGLCGCKVINKKKGTTQCEHNLFWTAPRTIWLCGTQKCQPDEKCMCASEKKSKKKEKVSKDKSSKTSTKTKSKTKGEDEEETKAKGKTGKSTKATKPVATTKGKATTTKGKTKKSTKVTKSVEVPKKSVPTKSKTKKSSKPSNRSDTEDKVKPAKKGKGKTTV